MHSLSGMTNQPASAAISRVPQTSGNLNDGQIYVWTEFGISFEFYNREGRP